MTARVLTRRDELEALAAEWNGLLRCSGANSIFLTWEWISTWIDVVSPAAPLLVVAVRDASGRLEAIAPFYRRTMELGGFVPFTSLHVLGGPESGAEYPDLILRPESADDALRAIGAALRARSSEWDCIWLPYVASWTGARERWLALFEHVGMHVNEREAEFACVPLPDSHAALLRSIPEKMRKHLKQYVRRHTLEGPWRFVDFVEQGRVADGLDALFALHGKRWQARDEDGAFRGETRLAAFYRRFAPRAAERGWLRLYGLSDGSQVGAVQYGYVYEREFLALQEGFDVDIQPPGIGHVLRDAALRRSIDAGLNAYDFLGEYSDHKRRWGAVRRLGCDIFAGRRSLKNRLLFTRPVWPTGRFLNARPLHSGMAP
jgi:CelD/BcsL family acetyltransferase involved in cellulose biosynthesis